MQTSILNIKAKIQAYIPDSEVEVIDESPMHASHYIAESENNLPSHIKIVIKSDSLKQMSRVDSHNKIYEALREELARGLHAISIKIK